MDGNRFDAWTRRRFGLATAGALAALLARHHPHDTEAGRRCLRKGRVCANTSKRCCGKLTCDNKNRVVRLTVTPAGERGFKKGNVFVIADVSSCNNETGNCELASVERTIKIQ